MASIDVEALLQEVSPDSPAGEDLEYDSECLEVLKLAEGTPEQQMGDSVIEAQDPNWKDVKNRSAQLFTRSKDLRLAMTLMLSALGSDGFPGLRDGMALLKGTLQKYWDNLYPKLDPDDDNDPLERMNILISLAAPPESFGDPMRIQKRIREAPLTNSRQVGRFSYRDILIANGEIALPEGEENIPDLTIIDAAFADTATEELQEIKEAIDQSLADFNELDSWITETVGSGNSPNLSSFGTLLGSIQKSVQAYLAKRGYGEGVPADGTGAAAEGGGGGEGGGAAPAPIQGEVRSAQDVLLALDKICRYYETREPSSPVPLLLKRAQRLVNKNFVEIVEDLTPEALSNIQKLGGLE